MTHDGAPELGSVAAGGDGGAREAFDMEAKMETRDGQNQENLRLVRGGRYATRPMRIFTTAELRLDGDMKEIVSGIRGDRGQYPTRTFQRVLYDEAFPWRTIARLFVMARKANAPKGQLQRVLDRLERLLDELYETAPDRAA